MSTQRIMSYTARPVGSGILASSLMEEVAALQHLVSSAIEIERQLKPSSQGAEIAQLQRKSLQDVLDQRIQELALALAGKDPS